METVDDDPGVLDRIVLHHFGHSAFDLQPESAFGHHHTAHSSEHDFSTGNDSLGVDHHIHGYYGGVHLDANMLGVNDAIMYNASFSSLDATNESMDSAIGNVGTASSVVNAVASGAIDCSMGEPKLYAIDHQELSSSASPTDDKKSCTCKDCGKVFNSVWYLKQHAVKHSSERPFKCKYCHKTYRFRSNLYQHKCPLRDHASELAAASGLITNGGHRKISTSTTTDSPHPSSESSSSAEIGAAAGIARPRKRRVWPPLQSPPPPATSSAITNGGERIFKAKMRRGNQDSVTDATAASSASPQKWDAANRCAISISTSVESPTSPSSLNLANASKHVNAATLSDEEIQSFLDRHKDKLHKCPKCKSLWPSREYLTRHMEWHNDDSNRFRCIHCSETFVDEHRYGLHKQNHSPSSLHVCVRCRGKFCTRVALKKHARRCSMMDAKYNNGSGSVSSATFAQRSTASINGYRQALFIDPTPPPSPIPTLENGVDNHQENSNSDGAENEDAGVDSVQMTTAPHISPGSSNDGGMDNGYDRSNGNHLSNGFSSITTATSCSLPSGVNDPMNNAFERLTLSSALTTSVRMKNMPNDVANSTDNISLENLVFNALWPNGDPIPNTPSHGSGFNLSPITASAASNFAQWILNDSVDGNHSDLMDFVRDVDEVDPILGHNHSHNFTHFNYDDHTNSELLLHYGGPYFYHDVQRRLEDVKMVEIENPAAAAVFDSAVRSNDSDLLNEEDVGGNGGQEFPNLMPADFDAEKSSPFTTVIVLAKSDDPVEFRRQYSTTMQSIVPFSVVERKVVDADDANSNLLDLQRIEIPCQTDRPSCNEERNCTMCNQRFSNIRSYHLHWIQMHVLLQVKQHDLVEEKADDLEVNETKAIEDGDARNSNEAVQY